MFEAKCKPPNEQCTEVYYEIPKYYVPQILSEMRAYNSNELIFVCWSMTAVTVFLVQFDETLWKSIWDEVTTVYNPICPRRPAR